MGIAHMDEFDRIVIAGQPHWLHRATGRSFLVVSGGSEGDEGEPGEGGDEGAPPKTFTQAEVDRLVGRTRGEAKKAAASELADALGCTIDEAKAKIAAAAEADNKTKTDAQLALDAATAAKAEADAEKAAAKAERFAAKVERKLLAAGVGKGLDQAAQDKAIARAVRTISLDPDADDDTISAEIEDLKSDVPGLFTETTDDDTKPKGPPSGLTPGKPPSQQRPASGPSAARAAARKRLGLVDNKAS